MAKKFEIPKLKCLRCGHQWMIRNPRRPKVCPVCKRTNWDQAPGPRQEVAAD